MPVPGTRLRAQAIALLYAAGLGVPVTGGATPHVFDLSLEELLRIEIPTVQGVSGFDQKASDAASAVTVITAEDIRRFGYRRLGEALGGERGFYETTNLNYDFLGVRGFNLAGDYNSRFLLVVDGVRVNDPVFSAAPVGGEFPVDVDLIDRIEIIRGPGSSLYGSGAVLGVVNVITRRAESFQGMEVSGAAGSFDTRTGRASFGRTFASGLAMVASISGQKSDGRTTLSFPELASDPVLGPGVVRNADAERLRQLFLSLSYGDFRFQFVDGARGKHAGHGLYSTVFNDNRLQTRDAMQWFDLQYDKALDDRTRVRAQLYRAGYRYDGTYPYDVPPITLNTDLVDTHWWGADARVDFRLDERHRVSAGVEYVTVTRAEMRNFDIDPAGGYAGCTSVPQSQPCFDGQRSTGSLAFFAQDDMRLAEHWRLNAVVRHDRLRSGTSVTNPRLAVIHTPDDATAFKLIYGQSFRAPNLYERYFASPGYKPAPQLQPERARTLELIAEHSFTPGLRGLLSMFETDLHDLVQAYVDPADGNWVYGNVQNLRSRGAELELQGRWSWIDVRASCTWQRTVDEATGLRPPSSPAELAKLRLGHAFANDRWHLGTELRYVAHSYAANRTVAPGHVTANVVLAGRDVTPGIDVSLGVYNVANASYGDPASFDDMTSIHVIPRPGRTFRAKFDWRF